MHELGVRPATEEWDEHLRASEEKFRLWTARSE